MLLPDFLEFEAFNRIRARMGAERLGAFEFFDPRMHLTAAERGELAGGIELPWEALRCLHDYTLAYKNSRVLLWLGNDGGSADTLYHLAYCRSLQNLRRQNPQKSVHLATSLPESELWRRRVCAQCLQQLQYQGYDAARTRHRHYSDRILEDFDLEEFFRDYPVYPLSSELLMALDQISDA